MLSGGCCRLTATLTNTAAFLKLGLCKDCRDLFLSVHKLYFILLQGKPLSNQNLCSMSDLLSLGRAGVLAYMGCSVHFRALCALPAFSAVLLGGIFLLFCSGILTHWLGFALSPLLAVRTKDSNLHLHPYLQASSGAMPSSGLHFALLSPKGWSAQMVQSTGWAWEERLWVLSFQEEPRESSFPSKHIPLSQLEVDTALARCHCVFVAQCCCWVLPVKQGASLFCVCPGRLS